ncbi:unnamed protein product [Eruca vesicaria subsp. sativa]|uniref:SUEL-type lectin domain-containing protein n=1 Tax=Eruca vesicaria subsp. sativa TaxID=29727 RepID=A0ABC8JGB3_ERUVS|nr:unnamed protein product [Eruca vesicaria subsp. sativa]
MDILHSRRRGYILLLVLSYFSVFGFASSMNISNDARGSKADDDDMPFIPEAGSTDYGTDTGKEYIVCSESNITAPWDIGCQKTSKDNDVKTSKDKDAKTSKDIITKINFADYGNPSGKCEHYRHGKCGSPYTMKVVRKNCLGRHKCVFVVTDEMFGRAYCPKDVKFFLQITCTRRA